MENYKVKAQVALEFITAFICTIIFLVLTTQLFVWFGSTIVNRQRAYESTRSMVLIQVEPPSYPAMSGPTETPQFVVPEKDFYPSSKLHIFGKD